MQPKVTIILPVYNVEQYLRQCLDSVVNQTLREIQIICVNDGATDGSPAILAEYAAKDPRIEVYHQENQGGGSARNAAYSYIRGKYTYFVDPDDWIDLDLCQQCYEKAEETGVDIIGLRHIEYSPDPIHALPFDPRLPVIRQSPKERYETLEPAAPWRRVWRTDFLLSNNIRFSEGKRPNNDMYACWKGTVLANRIAVLDSPLYHYRERSGSYQQTVNEKHFVIVETFGDVEAMLRETGFYDAYKEFFLAEKLRHCFLHYRRFPPSLCHKFSEHIRQHRSEDERIFCRNAPVALVPAHIKWFYEMIDGSPGLKSTVKFYVALVIDSFTKAIKMPKRLLFQKIVKRIKKRLKIE